MNCYNKTFGLRSWKFASLMVFRLCAALRLKDENRVTGDRVSEMKPWELISRIFNDIRLPSSRIELPAKERVEGKLWLGKQKREESGRRAGELSSKCLLHFTSKPNSFTFLHSCLSFIYLNSLTFNLDTFTYISSPISLGCLFVLIRLALALLSLSLFCGVVEAP